jgi:hypothetical protein
MSSSIIAPIQLDATPAAVCSVLLFCIAGGTLLYCIYFLKVELKLHGLQKTFGNKFVVLSLAMGIFSFLTTLCDAIDNVHLSQDQRNVDVLFWMNNFELAAVGMHVCLLYLRTAVILPFAPKIVLFLKVLVVVVNLSTIVIIITAGLFLYRGYSEAVDIVKAVAAGLFCASVVLIDSSTAVVFAMKIREHNKQLGTTHTKANFQAPTDLIASTGLVIALLSLSAALVFAITLFLPVVVILTTLGALLWMQMKLRLEKITSAEGVETKPNVVKNDIRKTND